jgi:hypothetical protein
MILADPIVFAKPLHVWLGFVNLALLLTQISLGMTLIKRGGKRIIFFHTKVVWLILLIVVLIHGFYGFQLYFLR